MPPSEPVQLEFIFEAPYLVLTSGRGFMFAGYCPLCATGAYLTVQAHDGITLVCQGCTTIFDRYGKAKTWPKHTGILWVLSKTRS